LTPRLSCGFGNGTKTRADESGKRVGDTLRRNLQ
jgi:hypothetical protein